MLVPQVGWVDLDPTNDQFATGRYIVTAYGRDYSDVPPLNGVIYTEGATESLRGVSRRRPPSTAGAVTLGAPDEARTRRV